VRFMRSLALTGLLVATAALLSGCSESGPKTYPVTGQVTMNGAALTGVNVQFYPVDGTASKFASGKVDAQGNYKLSSGAEGKEGAQPGKYKVYLTPEAAAAVAGQTYGGNTGGAQGSGGPPKIELNFPEAWSQPSSTPMDNVEVKEQSNTIDIEVK
jgi:hypothetical protein